MTESRFSVTFAVLNMRLGGQVSSLTSWMDLLRARNIEAQFALPDGVRSLDKDDLTRFTLLDPVARLRAMLRMLRNLPSGTGDLVHLVIPTPSFTPLCYLLPTPRNRIIAHSEGLPTSLDAEHMKAFVDDPLLMLPRLFLNHAALVRAARRIELAHLVTTSFYARMLRGQGFRDVTCVENVARFRSEDSRPLPPDLEAWLSRPRAIVGYVGHAHPVKGVDDLLQAFESVGARRPDLDLLLALSPDGNSERLRQRAARLPASIRERVRFSGVVPVATLLARLDALVLPYRSVITTTLYPSLLLEADAAGCPLVVTSVPALEDVLPESRDRMLRVPPRDPNALARALEQLPYRTHGHVHEPVLRLPPVDERVDRLVALYRRLRASS